MAQMWCCILQVKAALQTGVPPLCQRGPASAFSVVVPLLESPVLRNALVTKSLILDLAEFVACLTARGSETAQPGPLSDFQVGSTAPTA
jgi:hypothetical protein